jgi:hypothetical protein
MCELDSCGEPNLICPNCGAQTKFCPFHHVHDEAGEIEWDSASEVGWEGEGDPVVVWCPFCPCPRMVPNVATSWDRIASDYEEIDDMAKRHKDPSSPTGSPSILDMLDQLAVEPLPSSPETTMVETSPVKAALALMASIRDPKPGPV